MEVQIQKQHLLAQAGVLANLKSSITPRRDRATPAVSNSLRPWPEPKSTVSGWALSEFSSTVSLKALISFRSRNVQFSASSRKSAALRGGILLYAAQAMPPIEAEIAGKGYFCPETS
jgi:hypothetical protein